VAGAGREGERAEPGSAPLDMAAWGTEMKAVSTDLREEIANALTHGVGALASLIGGSVLVTLAALSRDPWQIAGASIFVLTLVVLYTASTLYHAIPLPRAKAKLRVFDHCAIFLLIAGTYTPFTLNSLRGVWGWTLFAVVWTLAALGVVFKLFCTGRYDRLSTAMYVALGWLAVLAFRPMVEALPAATLAWLAAGGLAYTAGTVFYLSRRIPYAHAIWHLFVLAGSVCHFAAVFSEVAGGRV
jgi:hemolysin III